MKFGVNINVTSSKLLAYIIAVASICLTMYLEEVTPFGIGIPVAAALVLGKQAQSAYITKYENEESSNKH